MHQTFPLCFPYLCLQIPQYYVNIHLLSSGPLMISTFNLPVHLEFILIYIMRYGLDCVAHYASPLSSEVQFPPRIYHPLTTMIPSNLPLCVYELLFVFLAPNQLHPFVIIILCVGAPDCMHH